MKCTKYIHGGAERYCDEEAVWWYLPHRYHHWTARCDAHATDCPDAGTDKIPINQQPPERVIGPDEGRYPSGGPVLESL
jgi:hypothetical protein